MIIVWRVLDGCNLSCPFCAFDKKHAPGLRNIDPDEVLRFARVMADYKNMHCSDVMISLLGGEPFLWRPLNDTCKAIAALGLDVGVTTNGTTLGSPSVRREICDSYRELTISLDGFSNFHDGMRGWPGGFGKLRSWLPLLAREARARDARLKLRANVVLMRQNIGDFPALCREMAGWGVAEITFNQLGGRDRPEFYPAHRLRIEDVDWLESILPGLRHELQHRGTTLIGGARYLARLRASARDIAMPVDDCGPGETFLFIDELGRVSPCSFTGSDYAVDVDTLRQPDDIAALPLRFRQMQAQKRASACDDCLSTQVCDKFRRISAADQTAFA